MPAEKPGFLLVHTREPNAHRYEVYAFGVEVPEDEKRRFVVHEKAGELLRRRDEKGMLHLGHITFSFPAFASSPRALSVNFYPYFRLRPLPRFIQRQGIAAALELKALEHLRDVVGFQATSSTTRIIQAGLRCWNGRAVKPTVLTPSKKKSRSCEPTSKTARCLARNLRRRKNKNRKRKEQKGA